MRCNSLPSNLNGIFARYEFNAKYLLCSSDCESLSVGDLLAFEPGAEEGLKTHWLGYTESTGCAIRCGRKSAAFTAASNRSRYWSTAVRRKPSSCSCTPMLQPGDHLIVHWPCYQSLFEIAKSIGCEVTFWEARLENNWALDLEELKRNLRTNTRAIIVNTPHNPTGNLMPNTEFPGSSMPWRRNKASSSFRTKSIANWNTTLQTGFHRPVILTRSAVSLGVMSKAYGLAGLRIGWVATHNAPVLARMAASQGLHHHLQQRTQANTWLNWRCVTAIRSSGGIYRSSGTTCRVLEAFFTAHADRFDWVRPKAGPIAFPHLSGEDIEQFCHRPGNQVRRPAAAGNDVRPSRAIISGWDLPAGICRKPWKNWNKFLELSRQS